MVLDPVVDVRLVVPLNITPEALATPKEPPVVEVLVPVTV